MYGSKETDLVVKYYDTVFGISGEAELSWYLERVRLYGGPVLDLGCGTGRLALLMAEEGYEVTGIDHSKGMLELFKSKLVELTSDVRKRIRMENHSMSNFNLGRRYNTIICCDAFFHNLTVEDEINCLGCVARHLSPGGHFVFNLPNPTCGFILAAVASAGHDFKPRGSFALADGSGSLLVEQAQAANIQDQRITTTIRIVRYDPTGKEVESGNSYWTTRYMFKYEAIHLLTRCGFKVNSLVGDYKNGPVKEDSQLIFDVSLSNGSAGS